MRVYLDHNATAPLVPAAREALARAAEAWGNPSSLHAEGRARALLEDARERLAAFAACATSEVVLTSGATEAINAALREAAARGGPRHLWTAGIREGSKPDNFAIVSTNYEPPTRRDHTDHGMPAELLEPRRRSRLRPGRR